jgi:hypothetical protein
MVLCALVLWLVYEKSKLHLAVCNKVYTFSCVELFNVASTHKPSIVPRQAKVFLFWLFRHKNDDLLPNHTCARHGN